MHMGYFCKFFRLEMLLRIFSILHGILHGMNNKGDRKSVGVHDAGWVGVLLKPVTPCGVSRWVSRTKIDLTSYSTWAWLQVELSGLTLKL